jgi:hypothetical protein
MVNLVAYLFCAMWATSQAEQPQTATAGDEKC